MTDRAEALKALLGKVEAGDVLWGGAGVNAPNFRRTTQI